MQKYFAEKSHNHLLISIMSAEQMNMHLRIRVKSIFVIKSYQSNPALAVKVKMSPFKIKILEAWDIH